MSSHTGHLPLDIRTASRGVYAGFNLVVAVWAKLLILSIACILLAFPAASSRALDSLKDLTLGVFAGWYVYLMAVFVVFCLVLACLPASGRVKIGSDTSLPDYSTSSWLAMMFCSGIGVGILVFSVSEPISHFQSNPDILGGAVSAGSAEGVTSSLRFVFLHWGLSAWGCYALIGLALGLACHRQGQPMTMRSAVAPLFGKRLEGVLGHAIDVISILAIIAGITTTIVLGLEQICSGLSAITGSSFFADHAGDASLTALLTSLVIAISVAIASIVSGLERGVKWVSQIGIVLAFGVLAVFVIFGAGMRVFGVLADGMIAYVTTLPRQIITLYDPGGSDAAAAQRVWQGDWTIFYWAWWIAFSPFVGLFLARISRGRSVREFILGAMLGPSAMCFIWFAGVGGSALLLELDGTAGGRILEADHATRVFEAANVMLGPVAGMLVQAVLTLLFLVLIVASSTAAIIAIKSIGAAGSATAESPFHSALWALIIAAITGAIMMVNGVAAIRDMMIVGAVPFSLIMALMVPSIARTVFMAARPAP